MPKIYSQKTDILNVSERKLLESYLVENMNRTNMAILLCLFTGLRIGEVCGLKWEDIDFTDYTLSVKEQFSA